jgi:hypothetical protein
VAAAGVKLHALGVALRQDAEAGTQGRRAIGAIEKANAELRKEAKGLK